jgi:hypothetical protein
MSASVLKLTDAIQALSNGNESLDGTIRRMTLQRDDLTKKIENARREWEARGDMLAAMIKVQKLFPENETIKFTIPAEYDR